MIVYGLALAPLAQKLRDEFPTVLQPWYANDAAMEGRAKEAGPLEGTTPSQRRVFSSPSPTTAPPPRRYWKTLSSSTRREPAIWAPFWATPTSGRPGSTRRRHLLPVINATADSTESGKGQEEEIPRALAGAQEAFHPLGLFCGWPEGPRGDCCYYQAARQAPLPQMGPDVLAMLPVRPVPPLHITRPGNDDVLVRAKRPRPSPPELQLGRLRRRSPSLHAVDSPALPPAAALVPRRLPLLRMAPPRCPSRRSNYPGA
jgi:hypothetical protein